MSVDSVPAATPSLPLLFDLPPSVFWATLLLVLLVAARLLRPARLASLRLPLAATAAVVAFARLAGAPREHAWLLLLALPALLVLAVRAGVMVFVELFRRGRGEDPPALLGSLLSVLAYGLGVGAIAHGVFGIALTPFLATSAVLGAVVGLALQETLGNLFAGIALHTEGPFRVGDWIQIGEFEGRVDQISWRATRLHTWSGDDVTIPNNELARRTVVNFSLPSAPHSRVATIGVSYEVPPNRVLETLSELLQRAEGVLATPAPTVRLIGYRDSSMEYEVRYYVTGYDAYRRAEGEIYRLIWYHFRRAGIEIPFPIRTVQLQRRGSAAREAHETAGQRLERLLRAVDLFRPLSEDEFRLAAENFRHLHYSAGEHILQEGDRGDSFFIIDRGEVEVSKAVPGGQRSVALLDDGQFFGEMALLTGEVRSASVQARTDVDLFTIDKAGFEQIVVQNPRVTVDISSILAARRDALTQAEGDATLRFNPADEGAQQQRILGRIRAFFGL